MLLSIPCGGRAGLRNDKNESGCLPLIGLEGKVPLPRMPTSRPGAGAGRKAPRATARIQRGSCHFKLRGGGSLHRCWAFEEKPGKSRTGNANGPHFLSLHLALDLGIPCAAISSLPREVGPLRIPTLRMGPLRLRKVVSNSQYVSERGYSGTESNGEWRRHPRWRQQWKVRQSMRT